MLLCIILPLLALLPNSLVTASFNPFIAVQKRHITYLSVAVGLLYPTSQGSVYSPSPSTLPGHHHHGHQNKIHPVRPLPSATPGCGLTCSEPLTSAPFGFPCSCVLPMKVRLLLGVSAFLVYPKVTELEIEVASGTYLKQSQVAISGVVSDNQNQEKSVVDIILIPLGDKFDNTTVTLIYQRFLQKKVHLNRSLFGDYDVMQIKYSGFPDLLGMGPTISTRNHQNPIAADYGRKNGKRNRRIMFIIALSTFVLLVVCFFAAFAVVLNCRKVGVPCDAVSLVLTPPINKRFGKGSQSSSPTNSTSASFVSAMPASVLSVKTFSIVELKKATENFSSEKVLGEGGFGCVYHGIFENGTEVAVKLLKRDTQNGDFDFIAEIKMLSRLHHRNLVKLIGICVERGTRCLVYELVPNGSVESHLHGADRSKGTLDWEARLKIALGAARGLAYLHEDSNPHIIHRDFKASNVLLEDDFTPKVSDFGLAREATEGSNYISTRVMGTFGYVAPEYAMTGHLLVKSDVYSYGVVLLELLTGRKPVDMSQNPGHEHLVTWARPLLTNPEALEQLVDPALSGTYDPDDVARVALIASTCVHLDVSHRPFMGEVVQALKLICTDDDDETCGDTYSPELPSSRSSDLNGDLVIFDGSWWNAGCVTPRQGSPFVTTDCSSGYSKEFGNERDSGSGLAGGGGGGGLPTRHENRSGPLRVIGSNRDYYRLRGSVSEHTRNPRDDRGDETSF